MDTTSISSTDGRQNILKYIIIIVISLVLLSAIIVYYYNSIAKHKMIADYIEAGNEHFSNQQYHMAIISFNRALNEQSDNIDALRGIGVSFFKLKNYNKSIEYLNQLLIYDNSVNTIEILASAYYMVGEYEKSKEYNEKARTYENHNETAYYWLSGSLLFWADGEYENASRTYLYALEHNPGSIELLNSLGYSILHSDSCVLRKNCSKAVDIFKKLIDIEPDNPDFHVGLASAYLHQNIKLDEALKGYKLAIELDGTDYIQYMNLGKTYYILGEYNEALAALMTAQELAPDTESRLYPAIGRTYYYLGEYEKAIQSLNRNNERSGIYARNCEYIGRSYYKLGRYKEADEQFALVDQLDPDSEIGIFDPNYNKSIRNMELNIN
ncbi:tetratricopeptide repeat protein [Candidatus Woesearchaeota archaeon]|nr:tetratricopeptide repeat protein [Candidatus Woesearchaeota archaeon]